MSFTPDTPVLRNATALRFFRARTAPTLNGPLPVVWVIDDAPEEHLVLRPCRWTRRDQRVLQPCLMVLGVLCNCAPQVEAASSARPLSFRR